MFDEGSERLEASLDIVKIVKSLKKLKILMENSFMTDDVKKQIKHSEKNLIFLSSNSSGDEKQGPKIAVPTKRVTLKNKNIHRQESSI